MSTELLAALKDAATSIETVARLAGKSHYVGDDGERIETYMEHHDQVRGYAASRATCAREALAAHEALAEAPAEPIATVHRGGLGGSFGKATTLVKWETGADLLPNGEHKLYAHPAPQPQQADVAQIDDALEKVLGTRYWTIGVGARTQDEMRNAVRDVLSILAATPPQAPAPAQMPTDVQILTAAEEAGLWPNTASHWVGNGAFRRCHEALNRMTASAAQKEQTP